MPKKEENLYFRLMEAGCIARNGEKIDILVNGRGVALTEKKNRLIFWSMVKRFITRKEENVASVVNWLGYLYNLGEKHLIKDADFLFKE